MTVGAREYDESDVRVRPGRRGTRPRTKRRPEHADAAEAMVITVDRGRWTCAPGGDASRPPVTAMRARELGRTPIVVGDRVGLVGDLSGAPDTIARIVRVEDRTTALRRTADDTDPFERVVVANAELLVVVTAVADPEPRTGFVDRCLVAPTPGSRAVLCLTKSDLADPEPFAANYRELDIPVLTTRRDRPPEELAGLLAGRVSALVGHSGVGKSTLVNALVPDAERAVGTVSAVGKGRHTTVAALALPLPEDRGGGWVVDTPGVRSFGLAHVTPDDVPAAFDDLASAIESCPRGCGHLGPPADPECALDELVEKGQLRPARLAALRRVLVALRAPW
ncbi:ribosome small subunit-dependent GTPase A [Pseudonocardia sp. CNS-139]|nr:ribosome small subunit-dependent GTPase A [Pseudonocardia sp. CNS-139]